MTKYVEQLKQFCPIFSSFEIRQAALKSQLCHSLQPKPQDFAIKMLRRRVQTW